MGVSERDYAKQHYWRGGHPPACNCAACAERRTGMMRKRGKELKKLHESLEKTWKESGRPEPRSGEEERGWEWNVEKDRDVHSEPLLMSLEERKMEGDEGMNEDNWWEEGWWDVEELPPEKPGLMDRLLGRKKGTVAKGIR
ncbi:MAG: hypothetical protein MUO24_04755 [Desulfobacterales bacterium]|nr:hypothetical protein [Desulfobacterales bacterium]